MKSRQFEEEMARKNNPDDSKGSKKPQKGGKVSQNSRSGGGPLKFARDVRRELGKVSWPDRPQLQQSTTVVILIVLVLMAYVSAWDFVFGRLAQLIFT